MGGFGTLKFGTFSDFPENSKRGPGCNLKKIRYRQQLIQEEGILADLRKQEAALRARVGQQEAKVEFLRQRMEGKCNDVVEENANNHEVF